MPAHVTWENERQWRQAIVSVLDDWDSGLRANVEDLLNMARDEARKRCPVDTGRLRNGIEIDVDTGGAHSDVTGILFDDVDYAPFVEFGTRYMRAQPFLRPGMAMAQARYEREMIKGLR
jgi:HK97 gp10 family phage protein